MPIVISVENLSKSYRLGQINTGTFTYDLQLWWAKVRGKPNPFLTIGEVDESHRDGEFIWALKDVSFQVQQGEVLGIIGRNGAGKSTLLKILSRVTAPTSGKVKIKGRIASLLEVGTGFHPDLTGRENVYLNGAIMGMDRQEVARKFDEIVDFSGVEQFIDTPVKRYSSGMYVRLAFAVAAHLDPEILVVDEVLAVGDAEFQKKCLGKMGEVANAGRTVLFVSHNMPAVIRLCKRSLLFDRGRIRLDGETFHVTEEYLKVLLKSEATKKWDCNENAPGNEIVRLRQVRVCSEDGATVSIVDIRSPLGIEVVFEVLKGGNVLVPNLHLFNSEGTYLFVSIENDPTWIDIPRNPGLYKSLVTIPGNLLAEGNVQVGVAITTFEPWRIHFDKRDLVGFQVTDTMQIDSARVTFQGHLPGALRPKLDWKTELLS